MLVQPISVRQLNSVRRAARVAGKAFRGVSMKNTFNRDNSHNLMVQLMVGDLPNLYWNAVSMDRLRGEQRYTALPPVHDVECTGVESYR